MYWSSISGCTDIELKAADFALKPAFSVLIRYRSEYEVTTALIVFPLICLEN